MSINLESKLGEVDIDFIVSIVATYAIHTECMCMHIGLDIVRFTHASAIKHKNMEGNLKWNKSKGREWNGKETKQ
jgi:dihydropteroate synthase